MNLTSRHEIYDNNQSGTFRFYELNKCYRLGTSARIDGIRENSSYEYVNGSGKIPFVPWRINSGDKKHVQLDTVSGGAFTDDSPGLTGVLCETPAAGMCDI